MSFEKQINTPASASVPTRPSIDYSSLQGIPTDESPPGTLTEKTIKVDGNTIRIISTTQKP